MACRVRSGALTAVFRFIHSADWHLGKRFGRFEEALRGRLREARFAIPDRLAAIARDHAAGLVVVAGDVWDGAAPADQTLRRPLEAMAAHPDLRWALLPGNHDPARPGGLWERLAPLAPANVILLTGEAPVEVGPGVFLLPAPCRARDAGRDLTAWMDAAPTPQGAVRIGVAHGSVQGFSQDGPDSAVIDPGRAERAGLAYLALGDWHGALRIGPRTWYSGAPEPERFRDNDAGRCLVVAVEGPGAAPAVAAVHAGALAWVSAQLDLAPGMDPAALAARLVPDGVRRADLLLDVVARGRASLSERAALEGALDALAPALAWLGRDLSALATVGEVEDLDLIDTAGALRMAADTLAAEAADPALDAAGRRAAADALAMLYGWCVEEAG